MKHLLSILLILALSIQAFSQKKTIKKKKTKPKSTVATKEVAIEEAQENIEKIIIDTLRIQKGKKYVLIVDANQYSTQVAEAGTGENNTEEAELKRNFPKENLQIISITKFTYVIFESKETLDISGDGKSFQAFAYWSGKMDDKVQIKDGIKMATEFVAQQLKSKKESSYVINTRKYKKEVASLQGKNKVTSKSKEVMKTLLGGYSLPFPDIETDNVTVFQQGTAKLKTLDSYFLKKKGVRVPLKSVLFNTEGLPASITYYDDEAKNNSKKEFIYKDGLLTKIMKEDQIASSINYDDNKMIFTENVGDANETRIYWLENGKLLQKSYTLMIDDQFSYMNTFVEEKLENNCISYYINNVIWSHNCSGSDNSFPFVNTYTTFQNKEVLQFRKSKIEKKNERTFEKYYSEAERADQNDNYKLWGTLYLDDYNLVDTYNFKKDNIDQTIKIDYTCYE